MYCGKATYEVGKAVYDVQTAFFDTIEEVVHSIAKMCRDGRIAHCDIWVRIKGRTHCIKSVTM